MVVGGAVGGGGRRDDVPVGVLHGDPRERRLRGVVVRGPPVLLPRQALHHHRPRRPPPPRLRRPRPPPRRRQLQPHRHRRLLPRRPPRPPRLPLLPRLPLPAQAVGAAGGVLAIVEVMPERYRHMLKGPSLKVDLHTGAMAEGVLTFVITLAVLWIIVKGPRSASVKTLMLSVTTVSLIIVGSTYTGPSMNPANAFGWAYLDNRHNTWEQFYVYWICPFVGSILAALVFRLLFSPPVKEKEKKA